MKGLGSLKYSAPVLMLLFATSAYGVPTMGPNGHYYEYFGGRLNYAQASADAASRTFMGSTGHLVTIGDQTENDFCALTLAQAGGARGEAWIAASDAATEGVWKWMEGPEAGTVFWNNGPVAGQYAYWGGGGLEPNNRTDIDPNGENFAVLNWHPSGSWNDWFAAHPTGHIVEFEGPFEVIPEPATWVLLSTGVAGLVGVVRRRRTTQK